MGAYGLIRAAETLPAAFLAMQDGLAALALFSLLYGAILAWRQQDLKAMVAYSSISHMGVVLFGIATLDRPGLTGAVPEGFSIDLHARAAVGLQRPAVAIHANVGVVGDVAGAVELVVGLVGPRDGLADPEGGKARDVQAVIRLRGAGHAGQKKKRGKRAA